MSTHHTPQAPLGRIAVTVQLWDEKVNPFRSLEPMPAAAPLDPDEQMCLERLAADFDDVMGQPTETLPSSAATDSPSSHHQKEWIGARSAWNRRLLALWDRCQGSEPKGRVSLAVLRDLPPAPCALVESWVNFVQSYPWQTPPKALEVWLSDRFDRMFSAIAPHFSFLFASPNAFDDESIFAMATLVHEMRHLEEGAQLGWRAFQNRLPTAVETPAMLAEKEMLARHAQHLWPQVAWDSCPLRYEWNERYAATPWRSPQEALAYLSVMNAIDPMP
jgi:hypothetical protein